MLRFRSKSRHTRKKDQITKKEQRHSAAEHTQPNGARSPDLVGLKSASCREPSAVVNVEIPAKVSSSNSLLGAAGEKANSRMVHTKRVDIQCRAQSAFAMTVSTVRTDCRRNELDKPGEEQTSNYQNCHIESDSSEEGETLLQSGLGTDEVFTTGNITATSNEPTRLWVSVGRDSHVFDDLCFEPGTGEASPAIIGYPGWLGFKDAVSNLSPTTRKNNPADKGFQRTNETQTSVGIELLSTGSGLLSLASDIEESTMLLLTNQSHHKFVVSTIDPEQPEEASCTDAAQAQIDPRRKLNDLESAEDYIGRSGHSELSPGTNVHLLDTQKLVNKERQLNMEETIEDETMPIKNRKDKDSSTSRQAPCRLQQLDSARQISIAKSIPDTDTDSDASGFRDCASRTPKFLKRWRKMGFRHCRTHSCPDTPTDNLRSVWSCKGNREDSAEALDDNFWPPRWPNNEEAKMSSQSYFPAESWPGTMYRPIHERHMSQPVIGHKWLPTSSDEHSPTSTTLRSGKPSTSPTTLRECASTNSNYKPKKLGCMMGKMMKCIFRSFSPEQCLGDEILEHSCHGNTDKSKRTYARKSAGYARRQKFMVQMIEESRLH